MKRPLVVALVFLTGCASLMPSPEQLARERLQFAAAEECKRRYSAIVSINGVDGYGRLLYTYDGGAGTDRQAFEECYKTRVTELAEKSDIPRTKLRTGVPTRVAAPVDITGNAVLVSVLVNGTTRAALLLDTGASQTTIRPDIAERAGVAVNFATTRHIVTTFGGKQLQVPVARLGSLTVGEMVVDDISVGVYDVLPMEQNVHGVLGMDFLRHFRMSVDYANKQLLLEAISRATSPAQPESTQNLTANFTGEIKGTTQDRSFATRITFTLVQTGDLIAGVWSTSNGGKGTLNGTIRDSRISDFRARQTHPCEGEFAGSVVIEAANTRMLGSYGGSSCHGVTSATFVVEKEVAK